MQLLWSCIQDFYGIPDFRVGVYGYKPVLWKIFYDIYSKFYDVLENVYVVKAGFREEMLRIEIARSIELEDGNTVLEICAGTCRNLALFTKLANGIYMGVDASLGMLEQRHNNLSSNDSIGPLLGFAENLPFKDEVFDKVLIGGCLGIYR